MKRTRKIWVATPTSGHVKAFMTRVIIVDTDWQSAVWNSWKSELNISKQI